MTTNTTTGPGALGGSGEHHPVYDKEGRAGLAAFRARMREGKHAVIQWLDDHGGTEKYAKTLHDLLASTDDRVRLGALKVEAQLREWVGAEVSNQVHIDARQQSVNVGLEGPALAQWMEAVRDGLAELGRGEPHEGNGHE